MRLVPSFLRAESGATAIEYRLIAAAIALVIVLAVNANGSALNTTSPSVQARLVLVAHPAGLMGITVGVHGRGS
jgi:Flp pilus assembly pilin Flp